MNPLSRRRDPVGGMRSSSSPLMPITNDGRFLYKTTSNVSIAIRRGATASATTTRARTAQTHLARAITGSAARRSSAGNQRPTAKRSRKLNQAEVLTVSEERRVEARPDQRHIGDAGRGGAADRDDRIEHGPVGPGDGDSARRTRHRRPRRERDRQRRGETARERSWRAGETRTEKVPYHHYRATSMAPASQ